MKKGIKKVPYSYHLKTSLIESNNDNHCPIMIHHLSEFSPIDQPVPPVYRTQGIPMRHFAPANVWLKLNLVHFPVLVIGPNLLKGVVLCK